MYHGFVHCFGICEQIWFIILTLACTKHNFFPVVLQPCRCYLVSRVEHEYKQHYDICDNTKCVWTREFQKQQEMT